jgi:membrane protein involved in colicin uptake
MGDILNRIRDGTAKVPTATKSLINTYGINKKNLYFFLQLQFFELLSYMNTEKSELESDPKSVDVLAKQWSELSAKQKELNNPRNTQYRDPSEIAKQRATVTVLLSIVQDLFMNIKEDKRLKTTTILDYLTAKSEANKAAKEKLEEDTKAKLAKEKLDAETKAKTEADAKAKLEAETKAKAEADAKAKLEAETKAKAEADAVNQTVGGRSRKIKKNKRRGKYTRKL